MEGTPEPNFGSNMLLVHAAITRSLELTKLKCQEFIQPGGRPDPSTMDSFVLYVRSLVMVVNGHHLGEDAIIFPRLRLALDQVPFEELYAEHEIMDVVLNELRQTVTTVDAEFFDDLLKTVDHFTKLWLPHIAKEKQYLYSPEITAAFMTREEQIQLLQETSAHALTTGNPALMLPFVLGNLDPKDRAAFSGFLPPEIVQELVPVVWKPQWALMQPFLLSGS